MSTAARQYVQDALFSDLHKDAFGFRPSQDQWVRWYAMSTAELDAEHDYMLRALERSMQEEEKAHQAAAVRFEKLVAETIASGAADRATAIRWLIDAEDAQMGGHPDVGYFEYKMGLKYGYVEHGRR